MVSYQHRQRYRLYSHFRVSSSEYDETRATLRLVIADIHPTGVDRGRSLSVVAKSSVFLSLVSSACRELDCGN